MKWVNHMMSHDHLTCRQWRRRELHYQLKSHWDENIEYFELLRSTEKDWKTGQSKATWVAVSAR